MHLALPRCWVVCTAPNCMSMCRSLQGVQRFRAVAQCAAIPAGAAVQAPVGAPPVVASAPVSVAIRTTVKTAVAAGGAAAVAATAAAADVAAAPLTAGEAARAVAAVAAAAAVGMLLTVPTWDSLVGFGSVWAWVVVHVVPVGACSILVVGSGICRDAG
jgi:hypothetical protein